MKIEIVIYKILSFILLPVAAVMGLICFLSLLTALANPTMLISVFLNACMVIYIIASFIFLTKGIDNNKRCKPVLRDWIRINGIITFVFYLLATVVFIAVKFNQSLLNDGIRQMESQGTLPPGVSVAELTIYMNAFINIFLILGILLLVHILITFRLLQRFRNLFEQETMDIEQ